MDKEQIIKEHLPATLTELAKAVGDKYPANTRRVLKKMEAQGIVIQNDHKVWFPVKEMGVQTIQKEVVKEVTPLDTKLLEFYHDYFKRFRESNPETDVSKELAYLVTDYFPKEFKERPFQYDQAADFYTDPRIRGIVKAWLYMHQEALDLDA